MSHSIVVIDDHEIAHSAIRLLLADRPDLKLDKCFREAGPALEYLAENRADLVVLDLDLPDREGLHVMQELGREFGPPVLILSGSTRVATLRRCREAGAKAIVSKGDQVEETLAAIDALITGGSYLSPGIVALLDSEGDGSDRVALSTRQDEILQLVSRGLSNKEISYELGIAQPTVSFHLRELSRKLGADHPRQLVERARSVGLL